MKIELSNPVELAVFSNLVAAMAEEACSTLERTAYSTFIEESKDFSVGIATPKGDFFAYPKLSGVPTFLGLPLAEVIEGVSDWAPGDVLFTNDPYSTGGLVTHAPDLNLLAPVFVEGELVAFCWGFLHSSDVGGAVPGSIAPSNKEIFQEGLRIPPMKLYRAGELNQDLLCILQTNVRVPHALWGDTKAMLSAFHVASTRLVEIFGKYGKDQAKSLIDECLLYTEAKTRAVIAKMPNGNYDFVDYLDDDVVSKIPIRIQVRLTISDTDLHLDFTGTDPQVLAAFNLATSGKKSHGWLTLGLQHFLMTEDQEMPLNAGILRPIHVTAPAGTVVHAVKPAAVGARLAAGIRVHDITLGALGQAVPTKVPAAGAGQGMLPVMSMPSLSTGGQKVNVLQPLVGGSGGRFMTDGYDGTDYSMSFMKNTPIEILESEMDVLVHSYYYVPDSAGPGRHRGGLGVGFTAQALVPDTALAMRGMERTRFAPWGAHGGECGSLTQPCIINRGKNNEHRIPKVDVLRLESGDIFELITSGGGGYGDPLERDLDKLNQDLLFGYVTPEKATAQYGAVIDPRTGKLDYAATEQNRKVLRRERGTAPLPTFNYGDARRDYEAVWTPEVYAELQKIYATLPIHARVYAKRIIMDNAAAKLLGDGPHRLTSAEIRAAWQDAQSGLGQGYAA